MDGFRWIKVSLFVLQFTAAAVGQFSSTLAVREGDKVTLPCENVTAALDNCATIGWKFFTPRSEGKKSKSVGLRVSENCSLVLQRVSEQDAGFYHCERKQAAGPSSYFRLYLAAVKLAEHRDADEVTFNCSVVNFGRCRHKVSWLFEGRPVGGETSQSGCSAAATFPKSHFIYTSRHRDALKCQVTHEEARKVTLFDLTAQSPECAGWSSLDYVVLALRVAELVLMTVITALLLRGRGCQGSSERNKVHPDGNGHDVVVNYENIGDPPVYVRFPLIHNSPENKFLHSIYMKT